MSVVAPPSIPLVELRRRWRVELGLGRDVAAAFVAWFTAIGYLEVDGENVRVTEAGVRASRAWAEAGP